jgi:hypothetical protein
MIGKIKGILANIAHIIQDFPVPSFIIAVLMFDKYIKSFLPIFPYKEDVLLIALIISVAYIFYRKKEKD